MKETIVRWAGGQRFIGTDSSKHSVIMSTRDEGIGVSPSELLMIALSACSSVDVVGILEKKKKKLTSLEVVASGEQNEDPPWAYNKINLKFIVKGSGLTEKDVAKAIELSEEKYCSVAATVRGVAEITTEFEIISED
ncbi:MAG: OsmC family protein [Anaerolineaceae bacterium]|nr:OsmC family protein [Anaerolineaceae bacterium]